MSTVRGRKQSVAWGGGEEQRDGEDRVEEVIALRAEGHKAAQQRSGNRRQIHSKQRNGNSSIQEASWKELQGSYTKSNVCLLFSAQLAPFPTSFKMYALPA